MLGDAANIIKVQCRNNHLYLGRDFRIEGSYDVIESTTVLAETYDKDGNVDGGFEFPIAFSRQRNTRRIGCPLCKSTLYSFENGWKLRAVCDSAWPSELSTGCPICCTYADAKRFTRLIELNLNHSWPQYKD